MDTQNAIDRALRFLARAQQPDGGFESFSSPTLLPFRPAYTYRTTFVPALILAALSDVDDQSAATIRKKLAAFLLAQRSPDWSYNYWTRGSQEAQNYPCPDDLDDTFCALSALWLHEPTLVDETALAHMTKLLIACEAQTGGPYRTWLTNNTEVPWHDTDLVVNANIQYFLSLVAAPLPNVTTLIEKAITAKTLTSPYYPDIFPIFYYLARSYSGPLRNNLVLWLNKIPQSTPLQIALATTSLLRLGAKVPPDTMGRLLAAQNADGSWPSAAFCIDPKRDGVTHYNGAAVLTTAFALETLCTQQVHPTLPQPVKHSTQKSSLFTAVTNLATQELSALDASLRTVALTALDKTLHGDSCREIILLPEIVYASLQKTSVLPDRLLPQLGLANLYGWMAYTIYDDLLDDEGCAQLLGLANVTMRRSLQTFTDALPSNASFQRRIRRTFDQMDNANTWEATHCRCETNGEELPIEHLPLYRSTLRLADRSLGHTLPPIGVLTANGATAKQITLVHTALRHYLAARQLNDDAHDWREDWHAGRITYVVAMILRGIGCKVGRYNIEVLMPRAEQYFWYKALPKICDRMISHTASSRRMLAQSSILTPANALETLLDRIDQSVVETQKTISQTEKFLEAYKK